MRLTVILLTACLMQVSAASLGQQITIHAHQASLKTIFKTIQRQSGYTVLAESDALQNAKPVTIEVVNAPLTDVLNRILQPQALDFTVNDKAIIIKKRGQMTGPDKAPVISITVTGKVVDQNNQPLTGSTVIIKGTANSTITDSKGAFALKNVAPGSLLVVSFIGYDKRELPAVEDMGTIQLKPATAALDEVKVVAYGNTTQRLSTGNISSVSGKEIAQSPVSNVLEALEGRVPGMFITQQSGVAGAGVSVSIQGQHSIDQGNDPFYVIDGVPYISQFPTSLGGGILGYTGANGTGTAGSPLALLNPADIESITVLKDAEATSIYGSRAANGAILIKTKEGKAGDTQVNVNLQQGWGSVAHQLELMNSGQYLSMRLEALKNDGITPSLQNGDFDLLQWDTHRYTDWQKTLIGGTAQYTDAQGSISGGTALTQFLIGAAYHRETTVFPDNYADQKGSLHFSFSNHSKNNKFNTRLTGSYLVDENHLPNVDFTSAALRLAPDAPVGYNPDGTLNWAYDSNGNATWSNPYSALNVTYYRKSNNLNSNLNLSYQPLTGLTISANLGYNNITSNEQQLDPSSAFPPALQALIPNSANYGVSTVESWIIEPQVNYKRTLGKGTIEALIGSTVQRSTNNSQDTQGQNYASDELLTDMGAAATLTTINSLNTIYKYNALFGRLSYNWNDEYLLNLSARRDGSSRFGPDNEFHNFGAVSAGWIFTKEALFADALPFLSFGKLKASYGTSGNDQLPDYLFRSQYTTYSGQAYQGTKGLLPTGLTNPYLQWELTKKIMAGIELGFLKDRILVNGSYSVNRSSNQLLTEPLSSLTGFSIIQENLPATVRNTSWEFNLNTINVKGSLFNWSSNLNLTIPKNKLVSFPGIAQTGYNNYLVVGQPLGIVKAFNYAGVDPQTGVYQFRDHTGALTDNPDPLTDNYKLINTTPKFYGGFSNTLTFHSVSLSFLLQFVKQTGLNDFNYGNVPGAFNGGLGNQPVSVLSRWQSQGEPATIQKYSSNFGLNTQFYDLQQSTAAYSDISYIKLKNVSLSWSLPANVYKAAGLNSLRIYAQGQNLYTWTKYKGLDPENNSTLFLPPLRVCTLGVQAGF